MKVGPMMKLRVLFAIVGCCGSVLGTAQAFQESATGAPVTQGNDGAKKTLDLSTNKGVVVEKDAGGGIKFPGLGAIGVLPKLDFGLELLYGESQEKKFEKPREDQAIGSDDDGLRIKGTLKHRF
jgi:hypothetical protein